MKAGIDFTVAALGGQIEVPTLYGDTVINIPAGTQSGAKITLNGKGLPKTTWGKGDQIVEVVINVPKSLSSKAKQLLRELENEV